MQRTVVCMGHIVFTAQVTGLGTIPLAAHSIAITAEEAFYMPGSGFQAAATTLCGQALGAGDKERVKHLASLCAKLCIIVHTFTGVLLFLFPEVMMSIFTPDLQVIALGASVLRIVSVSEPFFGLTMVLEGVFSGIGDTKPPFYVALFSMWFLRILPTFICVRVLGLGLRAVWCCMILEVIGRSLLLALRYAKKNWDLVSDR
jgi:putative MATE family efflux protein